MIRRVLKGTPKTISINDCRKERVFASDEINEQLLKFSYLGDELFGFVPILNRQELDYIPCLVFHDENKPIIEAIERGLEVFEIENPMDLINYMREFVYE